MATSFTRLSVLLGLMTMAFGCNSTGSSAGSGDAAVDAAETCVDGATRCSADGLPETCAESAWVPGDACPEGQACTDGACVDNAACEPETSRCRDVNTLEVCSEDGTEWEAVRCMEGECREANGAATCDDVICIPGERTCNGTEVIVECDETGTRYNFLERCNGARTGRQCDRGECVPLCVINEKVRTNIGCDYWAADLDNAFVPGGDGFLNAARAPYAIVVSNPHPSFTGEVTIHNNEEQVDAALVPPLGLHVFNLPHRDIDQTSISPKAYRVRSSIPIVAYQFNPLDNEEVFSNDASLLLPSHVLGDRYYVMTREQSFDRLRGFLTVIGIREEPTQVTVTVTARTQPGIGAIPGMEPGDTFQTVLNQYDVLNIETQAPGADLTGSLVEASGDVVVFGGSEAANVPNTNHCVDFDDIRGEGVCEYDRTVPCEDNYDCNEARLNTCCADHIEQQLFPIKTWGRRYIASKSYDRNLENDYWRILAAEDDTKVQTVPPQTMIPTLDAGEWFEFGSREHFEILSDKPILVGQFLASEHAPNPNVRDRMQEGDAGTGDPAFILAVPVEQFRQDFVFLAPDKYEYDFVSIIAPINAEVFFDDQPIAVEWEPLGEGEEWHVARYPIGDGVHFVRSDLPVAVVVYGYDDYVSYGYPGGLNLDVVDPETGDVIDMPAGE